MDKLKTRQDVTKFNTPVLDQNIYAIPEEHAPKISYINTLRNTPEVLKRKYAQEANQYWQEVKDQERQEKAMKELERFADISSPSTYINLAADKLRGKSYGTTNSQLPTGVKMLEDVLVPSAGGLVVKGGKGLIRGGKDLAKKTIEYPLKKKHPIIWELSNKDFSQLQPSYDLSQEYILNMLNANQHKTLPNLNQSFLDRLRSYRTLIARQEPQLYENAVLDNELQSNLGKIAQLSKKYNKLQKSIDKSRDNAVSLNTAKKLFPGTFEYIQGQEKLLKKNI